jgi:hypothetical protein
LEYTRMYGRSSPVSSEAGKATRVPSNIPTNSQIVCKDMNQNRCLLCILPSDLSLSCDGSLVPRLPPPQADSTQRPHFVARPIKKVYHIYLMERRPSRGTIYALCAMLTFATPCTDLTGCTTIERNATLTPTPTHAQLAGTRCVHSHGVPVGLRPAFTSRASVLARHRYLNLMCSGLLACLQHFCNVAHRVSASRQ